ncbi:uncharacterized protein E0L32_007504 [Thyridium curvatum]|uniref:Uncharacterized protein n=1 Tax=Thyridium curvatum TaxID=1093900 RepID=A0A507AWC3_9PEZI|nr:uncharacterized protein E0L32_007504 [Thyridium curvatum]TPX11767.1 hypothetical protein E0L32_007504 [Thyridium curvatum]
MAGRAEDSEKSQSDRDPGRDHVRHYPLDCGRLAVHEYSHQRLTGRDVIANRVMRDFMAPKRCRASVYTRPARCPACFNPVKTEDKALGNDVEILRMLLYTAHPLEPIREENVSALDAAGHPSVGDLVLDLVQRHFLETSDPAFKLWIEQTRPPPPRPCAHDAPHRSRERNYRRCLQHQLETERKVFRAEHTAHLQAAQDLADARNPGRLFDGDAFLPMLRQSFDRQCKHPQVRDRYLANMGATMSPCSSELYDVVMPFMLAPVHRTESTRSFWTRSQEWLTLPLAEHRRGRPLHRPEEWATDEGRPRHRHRRASCPDLKSFGVAHLPWHHERNASGRPQLQIIFRRLPLSELDRRAARPRSLSRRRIADMFVQTAPDFCALEPRDAADCADTDSTSITNPTEHSSATNRRWRPFLMRPRHPDTRDYLHTPAWCTLCENHHSVITDEMLKAKYALRQRWRDSAPLDRRPPCENCASPDRPHPTAACLRRCGFCGAPNPATADTPELGCDPEDLHGWGRAQALHPRPHTAPACLVAKVNRCKCAPFPTYHRAKACPVPCARCPPITTTADGDKKGKGKDTGAGAGAAVRATRHRAMTCKVRCCMCGIRGHSGHECRQMRCRCGGAHLGQYCGWQPGCRVEGCDRYLCGVHCDECEDRGKPCGDGGVKCARKANSKRQPRRKDDHDHETKDEEVTAENDGEPKSIFSMNDG